MVARILVPVDFSPASLQALDQAIDLAGQLNGELTVLHVIEPTYQPLALDLYGAGGDSIIVYDQLERSAREQLARLAARLHSRGVAARTLLGCGSAAPSITESAKQLGSDLIIMATHGRTGVAHVLLGSIAEKVLRTAPCPVMTVREMPPVAAAAADMEASATHREAARPLAPIG